jgi:hypothetical protein
LKKDELKSWLHSRAALQIVAFFVAVILLLGLLRLLNTGSPATPALPGATSTPALSHVMGTATTAAAGTAPTVTLNAPEPEPFPPGYPAPTGPVGPATSLSPYPGPAEAREAQSTPVDQPAASATQSPSPAPGEGRAEVAPTWAEAVQAPYLGIWIGREELAALPTCGMGWRNLKSAADHNPAAPRLRDQNDMNDVYVLAKALVYGRTGEDRYRQEVLANIQAAMGTEEGGRTLALGRNLVAYVIAADLVNLPADADLDRQFRAWLVSLLDKELEDGASLRSIHEERPNNWGTHAGASRVAVAVYLGQTDELARAALVFRGWLGDRAAYAGFSYGRLTWQAEPETPVAINPPGSSRDGYLIDGALPEEMRRGGAFQWPPKKTGYPWEALQGALVQAQILHRARYPAWEWQEQALLRAVRFLYAIGWEAKGDDAWQPWLINYAYGSDFPAVTPARPGKNMGWTDWTHAPAGNQPCLSLGDGG